MFSVEIWSDNGYTNLSFKNVSSDKVKEINQLISLTKQPGYTYNIALYNNDHFACQGYMSPELFIRVEDLIDSRKKRKTSSELHAILRSLHQRLTELERRAPQPS
jgi:hypothetical protein